MSAGFGDVQAGYVVALGTLTAYGLSLIARERAARRRLPERGGGPGRKEGPAGGVLPQGTRREPEAG